MTVVVAETCTKKHDVQVTVKALGPLVKLKLVGHTNFLTHR